MKRSFGLNSTILLLATNKCILDQRHTKLLQFYLMAVFISNLKAYNISGSDNTKLTFAKFSAQDIIGVVQQQCGVWQLICIVHKDLWQLYSQLRLQHNEHTEEHCPWHCVMLHNYQLHPLNGNKPGSSIILLEFCRKQYHNLDELAKEDA